MEYAPLFRCSSSHLYPTYIDYQSIGIAVDLILQEYLTYFIHSSINMTNLSVIQCDSDA